MELVVNGQTLARNEQGFLLDKNCWNTEVAEALACEAGIVLSAAHWEIIHFMREYYAQYKHLPNSRVFVKAIRNQFGEEKGASRYLQQLFPEGPLKFTCKIAGLPKPPTCL